MRKTGSFLVVLYFLLALFPISALASPAASLCVKDLIAGQNIDVGDVTVWNDADNLFVKYETTGNWYLVETHLHIADDPTTIPQKNGNPIPGKFTYQTEHLAVQSHQYSIDLDSWGPLTVLSIAAHAEVIHITSECVGLVSDASVEWLDGSVWMAAVPCWTHGSWPSIPGASWIWRTVQTDPAYEYANVPIDGWSFKKDFVLPDTAHNIQGTLDITADNAYALSINGIAVGGDGAMNKDGPDYQQWMSIEQYSISDTLKPGPNTLSINAMNYFDWGTSTTNPAGLIFKAEVCYDYIDQEESAWGDGIDFEGKNWATYFEYTVQYNLEGDWVLRFVYFGNWDHDMTVTCQYADGSFEGIGGYPFGGPYTHPWTVTGYVDNENVEFTIVYGAGAPNPGYTVWAIGIIATDGSMSGTWSSSIGQTGNWMSLSGAAT